MNRLRSVLSVISVVLACLCVGTTTIQGAAVAMFWTQGTVTRDKLLRFAAVTYGLDLSELPGQEQDHTQDEPAAANMSHEAVLKARVNRSALLAARQSAVQQGTDDAHILFQGLKSEKKRFDSQRTRFDNYLAQLERDIRASAIQEVRQTLEILKPRQSKQLILRMLRDEGLDPEDDVVADVVTIFKAMSQDKLKRILSEFKSTADKEKLHRILVEIGELENF